MITAVANSEWTVTSMTDVARFFGVSHAVVRNDWRSRGMPGENGHYELDKIAQWKIERERERFSRISEPDPDQENLTERLEIAQVRKAEADAILTETKAAQLRGELVKRNAVKARLSEILTENKILIQQIPKKLASSFPPETRADNTADVEHMIRLILKNMANKQHGITDNPA